MNDFQVYTETGPGSDKWRDNIQDQISYRSFGLFVVTLFMFFVCLAFKDIFWGSKSLVEELTPLGATFFTVGLFVITAVLIILAILGINSIVKLKRQL